MKSQRYVLPGFLAAVFLCLMVVNASADARVVARVGSVPITDFELNQKLQKLIPLASSFHSGISNEKIEKLKEKALDELIESAYMVQYALNEEISIPKADVDNDLDRIRSSFKSEKAFHDALGNISISELRGAIYRKLLADKALEEAVSSKVDVKETDLRSYYDENKDRFKRPRQFRASHILLKVDPSATKEEWNARLDFARELVAKARAGDDFYNLAYYNSDDRTKYVGGDMGVFHQGQVMKEIENEILKMKVGDISDPIETIYGYSIIKLVSDEPPKQLDFNEIKDKLVDAETKRQFESLKKSWLNELKSQFKVERIGT